MTGRQDIPLPPEVIAEAEAKAARIKADRQWLATIGKTNTQVEGLAVETNPPGPLVAIDLDEGDRKPATCNALMAEFLQSNPHDAIGLSAEKMGQKLGGFAKSTVAECETWGLIQSLRAGEKLNRGRPADKRRNNRTI